MIKGLFSIFFAICIAVHVYGLLVETEPKYGLQILYIITYSLCWKMFFSNYKFKHVLYGLMATFPFFAHFYYGYLHFSKLDFEFWICLIVCTFLPIGFFILKKK